MQRKAILIDSSNAIAGRNLQGPKQDVENWKKFLKSDVGGLWDDEEIPDISSCPLWKDILDEINKFSTTDGSPYYLFLTFSGHGAYDEYRKDDIISLNNNEVITVSDIFSAVKAVTKNSVIIIDACREKRPYVSPTPINDFTQNQNWIQILEGMERHSFGKPLLEGASPLTPISFSCTECPELRGAYCMDVCEKWKESLDESGPILIQSCSEGEFANEQGCGMFSISMLEYAMRWSLAKHEMYEILSVSQAFCGACSLLKGKIDSYNKDNHKSEKQTPYISDLESQFPFAVNINKLF